MCAGYFDGSTNETTDDMTESYESYEFDFESLNEFGTEEQVFSIHFVHSAAARNLYTSAVDIPHNALH